MGESVYYSSGQRAQILAHAFELHKTGQSWTAIAKQLKISRSTLGAWVQSAQGALLSGDDVAAVVESNQPAPEIQPAAPALESDPPALETNQPGAEVQAAPAPALQSDPALVAVTPIAPMPAPQAPFALPRYSPLAARLEAIEQLQRFEDRFLQAVAAPAVQAVLGRIKSTKDRFWRLQWGAFVAALREAYGANADREIEFFRFVWLSVNGYVPIGFDGHGL